MIIAVEGSKNFDNYETFMRGMGVALSDVNDSEIVVWSAGPHKINNFTASFCNSVENFLKVKGYKIKFTKVNQSWLSENMNKVNHFAYFSNPNEKTGMSSLAAHAELNGIDVNIYRY